MIRMLPLFTLLAVVAAFSAACEMSESCDPNTDPNCVVSDAGDGGTNDQGTNDQGGTQSYHYIMIEDLDPCSQDNPCDPNGRPGADIDAVSLVSGGQTVNLSQYFQSGFGEEAPTGDNGDFNNILGAPENQCQGEDPGDWDPNTFVSLGGEGGFVIASFTNNAEISNGDTITVHACAGDLSEEWELRVGVSNNRTDGNWFLLGEGVGVTNFPVQSLPVVPNN